VKILVIPVFLKENTGILSIFAKIDEIPASAGMTSGKIIN
jgi:hypothetical protein